MTRWDAFVAILAVVLVGGLFYWAAPKPFRCECDEMSGKPLQFEGMIPDYTTCLKMCDAFGPRG